MHQSSMDKMKFFRDVYLKDLFKTPLKIYDLGSCDINGSYRNLFDNPPWKYVGMDMTAGKNVDIILKNPYHWRCVGTDSLDVLISGQAFEHIEFFWITMLEVSRVLKSGGLCCIIAPSGGTEHRFPVDCWRFFPDGFNAMARFARMEILEVYTQWKPNPQYPDLSNFWRDTVLVARKPKRNRKQKILFLLWNRLMQRLFLIGFSAMLTSKDRK